MSEPPTRMLFDEQAIADAVKRIADEISTRHPEGEILFVGILKGSFVFLADLIRAVERPCQVDFARIASYGADTVSSGRLDVSLDITTPVKDRHVILVDDIVDTGLTLNEYRKRLQAREPASVEICALIDKRARREKQVDLDYCGFEIEDGFVVGYGLDCAERYRNLGCICLLEEAPH